MPQEAYMPFTVQNKCLPFPTSSRGLAVEFQQEFLGTGLPWAKLSGTGTQHRNPDGGKAAEGSITCVLP